MGSFSERMNLTTGRSIIQTDDMTTELRVLIWNSMLTHIWKDWSTRGFVYSNSNFVKFVPNLWGKYFKKPIDQLSTKKEVVMPFFRQYVMTDLWYNIYNFVEYIALNYADSYGSVSGFVEECNEAFESEMAGYRFIDTMITPIISTVEIESIENVLSVSDKYKAARQHITASLKLLSDKPIPDYRNSIKESISAVESVCCIIADKPKAGLIEALREIEKNFPLHAALKSAFSSLYGYTSAADGIRHKLLEDDNLKQEDAIYMIVTCSAFVNYLIKKQPL